MAPLSRRIFTVAAVATAVSAGLSAPALAAPGTTAARAPAGRRESPAHRRELRGMWVATVANTDWPSAPGLSPDRQRRELLDLLDLAVERRLNAVMFQVRPAADALWPSPYEPWSGWLTGTQGRDPGWDPPP